MASISGAIRLVREEVNQDAVEPLELDRLVRDIEVEMVSLGHAVTIDHLDRVSVKAGALGLRRALRNLIVNAATHGKSCTVALAGGTARRSSPSPTAARHPAGPAEQGLRALLPG
ncbi:hypothetical protein [Mesorhizobium sp. B4-1-3]|uniref:hypothetical protein n=1 Tax=Mesorhizobium sp. B4-1-3 TaxID=2589889 RepID=UPI001FED85F5|nr:hypothetical protein [Mesorhizobium sp. B4-1-3]